MSDNKEILINSQSETTNKELQPKTRFEYFLNKIAEAKSSDDSGESDILIIGSVEPDNDDGLFYTLTKTYREIKNATFALIVEEGEEPEDGLNYFRNTKMVTELRERDGHYSVNNKYETDNIDSYPVWTPGDLH